MVNPARTTKGPWVPPIWAPAAALLTWLVLVLFPTEAGAAGDGVKQGPTLLRPFFLTRDGRVWRGLTDPAEVFRPGWLDLVTDPGTRNRQVAALMEPLSLTAKLQPRDGPFSRVGQPRAAPSAASRSEALPALLQPFYASTTGPALPADPDSAMVASARWFEQTWTEGPTRWRSALWQPLRLLADEPRRAASASGSLVAYQEESETLPAPADSDAEGPDSSRGGPDSPADGDAESKGIGGEAKLGSPPEDNTLAFLRAATVLLKPGEMQMDVGLTYALSEDEFPLFLVPAGVTESRIRQRQLIMPLEFRYGLARRVQGFVSLPLGWSNTELAFNGTDEFKNTGGIGDVRAGMTFLLRKGSEGRPDVIATTSFTAPTGSAGILTAASPTAPANMGEGFWALSADVLLINNLDPVVFYYGVGTRYRFERTFSGFLLEPGGEYTYLFGAGFAVNEKVTLSSTFVGAYLSELYVDRQRVAGSIQELMSVRLAATVVQRQGYVEPFVTFGLTRDATTARIGIVWTR